FHETLNLAMLWRLPVLFICENNLYAMGMAIERADSEPHITRHAASYGMPAEEVDGMDVVAVESAARRAAEAIRDGGGPRFLECKTYRFRAHSMFDAQGYRKKEEIETWRKKGPIVRFQGWLQDNHLIAEAEIAAIESEVDREIAEAVLFAERGALEPVEDVERFVVMTEVPA
ncbi:MAG: thiamine pyrophosphate-dependent enzyme, partial [Roseiarcus sp.]